MQTEGGEEDQLEGRDPANDDDMDEDTDSTDPAPFVEEDFVNETSPAGRDIGNDERDSQDEVVEDTSAVGTED